MPWGEFKVPLSTAKILRKAETPDTMMVVQFCPSGEIKKRSVAWIYRHGGGKQLDDIRAGVKLDAPIFHDSLIDVEPTWMGWDSDYSYDPAIHGYRELD